MWLDRVNVVQAVWAALKPWNITVDDVDVIQSGKQSEQGIKFKIPQKQSSFFFGPAYCKFTRDNTNWDVAEETIEILDIVTTALLSQTHAVIAKRKTAIVLHVQPKNLSFMQIAGPLVPQQLAALEAEPPATMAIVVKWPNRKMTIDGSASVANGIFLRFEREFEGSVTYPDIAHQLRADEEQVFAALGVQEEE
jgi:hypothetical protein